jgi:glycosyltransferase involved in cell wall biosynthesis
MRVTAQDEENQSVAPTLRELLAVENDYGPLEAAYRAATGSELVRDPLGSVRYRPAPSLSVSIIVPGWNVASTIERCLTSIEQSSFNRTAPHLLEVVVVDDGSDDGTWEVLEGLQLGLNLKVARHDRNWGAGQARNTAMVLAEGEIVISLDGDVIPGTFAIEEMAKRHVLLDGAMLLGFYANIDSDDDAVALPSLQTGPMMAVPPFMHDWRVSWYTPGWPENLCRESDHLKRLGGQRPIFAPNGARWTPPNFAFSGLLGLRRADWLATGGYDERFQGWGWEDTMFGARAVALGAKAIPVYSAVGWHVRHPERSSAKWDEAAANYRLYRSFLEEPLPVGADDPVERATARIERRLERPLHGTFAEDFDTASAWRPYDALLDDPAQLGGVCIALGRYEEADAALARVRGSTEKEAWAAVDRGQALRALGRTAEAIDVLQQAAASLPSSGRPLVELALSLASDGRFDVARGRLLAANRRDPDEPTVGFILGRSAAEHISRASKFAHHGFHALAIRYYEAALMVDPLNAEARDGRAALLRALKNDL